MYAAQEGRGVLYFADSSGGMHGVLQRGATAFNWYGISPASWGGPTHDEFIFGMSMSFLVVCHGI